MSRFVLLSFVFMGFGFYELSGGSDFVPASQANASNATGTDVIVSMKNERDPAQINPVSEVRRSNPYSGGGGISKREPVAVKLPLVRASAPMVPIVPASLNAGNTIGDTPVQGVQVAKLETTGTPTVMTDADPVSEEPIAGRVIEAEPKMDLRLIKPTRANVRMGPGTRFNVVMKLDRGSEVRVLQLPGNGWAKIKDLDSNRIGWIAQRLLREAS